MRFSETRIGWLALLLTIVLSAGLFARSTQDSGAYFSDVKAGVATGTLAHIDPVPTLPFRVEPGASKGLHWGPGDDCPSCGSPISHVDSSGALSLDLGEAPAGHGNSRPDVFRLVSIADDDRSVTFSVTGVLADFVTVVRLGGDDPETLAAGETAKVYMSVRIPNDALPGTYSGVVTVHVQGWTHDADLPITIDIVEKSAGESSAMTAPGIADETTPSTETSATVPPAAPEPSRESTPTPTLPSNEDSSVAPPATQEEPSIPDPPFPPDPGTVDEAFPIPETTSTPSPTPTLTPTATVGVTDE